MKCDNRVSGRVVLGVTKDLVGFSFHSTGTPRPEEYSVTILRNIGKHVRNITASHPGTAALFRILVERI